MIASGDGTIAFQCGLSCRYRGDHRNMATTERQLAAVARRHLPPAVAEQWIALMRPAIRLRSRSGGKKPVGQLGGLPALPEGVAWPEWKDRGSLNFVASFDCGRLPVDQLDLDLPGSGTLLFFYLDPADGLFDPAESDYQVRPGEPETLAGTRVIYVPPGVDTSERDAPADVDPYNYVPLAAQLMTTGPVFNHPALRAAVRHLSAEDQAFMSDIMNSDPLQDELYQHMPQPRHWIGGHAHPVQDSVEIEVAYTHFAGKVPYGDPTLEEEAQRWTLLAQIDSDDEADMMWGDVGTLYWLMRPEDLAARRFEASSFTGQCS